MTRRTASGAVTCSIELVCLAIAGRDVVVLLESGRGRTVGLPSARWGGQQSLKEAVAGLVRLKRPAGATWYEQVGALDAGSRTARSSLAVVAVVLSPPQPDPVPGSMWAQSTALPGGLPAHQRRAVEAAVAHVRNRIDQEPLAFRLLPMAFTLGDLQRVHEVLLGRRLHKASFRRVVQAAAVVEATDDWKRDGRGRPAQLFRYRPPRRRGAGRALRFERSGPDSRG